MSDTRPSKFWAGAWGRGSSVYQDLGRNYLDRRSTDQQKKRLVKRLADLGYAVELTPLAVLAARQRSLWHGRSKSVSS